MFEEGSDQNQEAEKPVEPTQETPEGQGPTPPKSEDSHFDQMLQGITNEEGKPKYSSVQQALGSIPHAQKHINQLESDNKTLKDEIASLQEQLDEYKQKAERFGTVEELLEQRENKGLTQEELDQYLEQKLQQRETVKTVQQNQANVVNSLVEMYGDKATAEREFMALQNDLGIDLTELSGKSPKAVLRYFKKPESKTPDKFDTQARKEFKPSGEKPKPRMPRTTQESVSQWREVGDSVRKKYGIE